MPGDIPITRLEYFRKEIGLDETKLAAIRPYAEKLSARSRKAGKYLNSLIRRVVPPTRLELLREQLGASIKDFWSSWYASLWTRPWDAGFLRELWMQGFDAAKLGIDLQYVMLGDVKCRQLFIRAVRDEVPMERRSPVALAVNDLLDLCLIVRSKGHSVYHSHTEEPVLQGLFHQTRNPLTVIGGTAMRLKRIGGPDIRDMAQVILDEALRLERMTRDISTLNAVEMTDPAFGTVNIRELLELALHGLKASPDWPKEVQAGIEFDPSHFEVDSDPALLREIFKEVFANALEALPPSGGVLTVSTRVDENTPNHLTVVILNSGELPHEQDVAKLFLPFHSNKPRGTGFGLPIAWVAARKVFGSISLTQTENGVACTVKLPLKGQIDETGLLARQEF